MSNKLTAAQTRLVALVRSEQPNAEYWPVVNDWVKDSGPAASLAFRNIERTVDALIRRGALRLDTDGYLFTADYIDERNG
jgi:hypothetical protein